jgi:hypothetical protein
MKKILSVLALFALATSVLLTAISCTPPPAGPDPKLVKFNTDSDNLIMGLQQFKEFTGSYPVGDNAEIARSLLGQTEKKVLILAVRKSDLNNKGEITDAWGTPLQFFFSKNGVLIRSAGPNKVFEDSANPRCDDLFRTEMTAK